MKERNTTNKEFDFSIPSHWVDAAKTAKKIIKDFTTKVSFEEFLSWNRYKKYEFIDYKKNRVYLVIRHTKKWDAVCTPCEDGVGYIKINVNDRVLVDESGEPSRKLFEEVVFGTLSHELIHHFQDLLELEKQLPIEEQKKLVLYGNSFNSKRNDFLYATNWAEMDAEMGSLFIKNNFKIPSDKDVVKHYYDWYGDQALAMMIGTYVYNYMILGEKDLEYRESVFRRRKWL